MAKARKPAEFNMKLRSRKAIAAWILDALEAGYDRHAEKRYIFCIDCDDSAADFSFDRLLKLYQDFEGGEAAEDPTWIRHVRRHFAKEYCDWKPDDLDAQDALENGDECDEWPDDDYDLDPCSHGDYTLYDYANEDMQRLFGTNLSSEVPDDDTWNTLWDGTNVSVKFGYVDRGYADNTLALIEFEGYACTDDDLGKRLKIDAEGLKPDYYDNRFDGERWSYSNAPKQGNHRVERDYDPEEIEPLSWDALKKLYEYIQWFKNWFAKGNYKNEMEYQASWSFFENICDGEDFPNPTQDRIDAEWTQKQKDEEFARRQAFLDSFRGIGRRAVEMLPGKRLRRAKPGLRRRVEFVDMLA